eukprot:13373-Eustigmatos_ZCMA.PRE.1
MGIRRRLRTYTTSRKHQHRGVEDIITNHIHSNHPPPSRHKDDRWLPPPRTHDHVSVRVISV